MRMRTKLSIVAVIGAGALLLCVLAVIFTLHTHTAYASSQPPDGAPHDPYVEVSLVNTTVVPGEYLDVGVLFHSLPCSNPDDGCNYEDNFVNVEYWFTFSGGPNPDASDACSPSGLHTPRPLNGAYSHWRTTGPSPIRISSECQPGSYTINLTVEYPGNLITDSESFQVSVATPTPQPTQRPQQQQPPQQQQATATPTNDQDGNQGNGQGDGQGDNGQGDGQGDNSQGDGQGDNGQGDGQGDNGQGDGQGDNGQGDGQGDNGQGDGQGDNGQGDGQGDNGQGDGQGDNGQGDGQDDNGQGDGQGDNGQGDGQGDNGQGNGQGDNGQGNGGQSNQQNSHQNNNQGRSNNNGGNNQGGNKQGGVNVQSFISNPTPLPQSSQPQTQTPLAITIPEIMNVRTGPGLTYDIVTTVPAGTQGTIVGTDPDNDWYQVEIGGIEGQVWIYQDLTSLVGSLTGVKQYTALEITQLTTGTPSGDGTAPLAITIPELMNVRTGPGLTYNIVTTVPAGTQGYIYGIDPNDDWFHIELEGFETRVWIYQDLTTVIGSLAGVKLYTLQEIAQLLGTPGADGSVPLAITVPITMNVRTGPGLLYDIVGVVPQGTQGRIFGIDPNNDWFQIELEGLDTLVWVYQDLTTVIGSLASVKWVTLEELALLPAAITQPLLLNARAGPGLTYDILTTIPQGTWTKITGIDTLGEWYRVELDDLDQQVWVFRDFTKVAGGSLSGLIKLAFGGTPTALGLLTSSITVDLSLPLAGGVDMEVSWVDRNTCAQLYSLYHRSSTDTTTYISLDQAATASTVNSKSLSFSTLSGSSYISAWCGQMAAGREVAEVEIDPGVAGTYSSTTTSGGLATVPDTGNGSR